MASESPPGQEIGEIRPAPLPSSSQLHCWTWGGDGGGHVAAGYSHSVIKRPDGTVVIFGKGSRGVVKLPGITNATFVAAGGCSRTAIVTADGSLLTCGVHLAPQRVAGLSNVVGVACGSNFTVALLQDGSVFGFGTNSDGQLGVGGGRHELVLVPRRIEGLPPVIALSAGNYSCVYLLAEGGRVATAGYRTEAAGVPVILPDLENVIGIAAGASHYAAVTVSGRVATWGTSKWGQLGHGTTNDEPRPRFIEGIYDAIAVSCGQQHTAILHQDGSVSTFGCVWYVGHGDDDNHLARPTKLKTIHDAIAVSCGAHHTIVLHADGCQVSTFGFGQSGELGFGESVIETRVPRRVGVNLYL
jgi:hypothetical protein